jgi:hypothetical protein
VGDLVSLNKYRKRHRRAEAAKEAAANRVRFGRDRVERATTRVEQNRQKQTLDGKRFEDVRSKESEQ